MKWMSNNFKGIAISFEGIALGMFLGRSFAETWKYPTIENLIILIIAGIGTISFLISLILSEKKQEEEED